MQVIGSEIRLGDVIVALPEDSPYSAATVKNVSVGQFTLFRPYVQTADFSYTGGVICYIGIEEWVVYVKPGEYFTVLARKELK